MEEKYTFNSVIVKGLPKSWEIAARSLGEKPETEAIIEQVAEEVRTIHKKNLNRKNRKFNHFLKKKKKKEERKEKGVQKIVPIGEDAVRFVTNIYVDTAEIQQEHSDKASEITDEQLLFRYLRSSLDNHVLEQGVFGVASVLFGIFMKHPTEVIAKVAAFVHGLRLTEKPEHYKHPNYRCPETFDREIARQNDKLYRRFAHLGRFAVEPSDQVLPVSVRKPLAKLTPEVIKLEQSSSAGEDYIYNCIELIKLWGAEKISAERIPNYDFNYSPIEDFEFREKNPADEWKLEMRRMNTLLDKESNKKILENRGVRYENMSNYLHSPRIGTDGTLEWALVNPISDELIGRIKNKELDRVWLFQAGKITEILIRVDGIEVCGTNEPLAGCSTEILPDQRIVGVYGKFALPGGPEILLSLGTLLIDYTNIWEGSPWESESKLPNKYHLSIKALPEINEKGDVVKVNLVVNYHKNYLCEYQSRLRNGFLKIWNVGGQAVRNLTGREPFPPTIEAFFQGMESTGYFRSNGVLWGIARNLLFLIILVTGLFFIIYGLLGFLDFANQPESTVISITIVACVALVTIAVWGLINKKGLNKVCTLSTEMGFFSGFSCLGFLLIIVLNVYTPSAITTKGVAEIEPQISATIHEPVVYQENNMKEEQVPKTSILNIGKFEVNVATESRKKEFLTKAVNTKSLIKGSKIQAFAQNTLQIISRPAETEEGRFKVQALWLVNAKVLSVSPNQVDKEKITIKFVIETMELSDGKQINVENCPEAEVVVSAVQLVQKLEMNVSQIDSPVTKVALK